MSQIATPHDSSVPSASSKRLLPWLVAVAFFMESLDTTILNTAVPAISEALHVSPLSMKSVLASYTLSLAVFIPISGWMADRFGTRRVFASAIGLFTLGSLLCGISTNIHLLVACRLLQGCGGAMMVPVGRLTLVRTFAKYDLIRMMSFVAIPATIGPMLGPVIGGFHLLEALHGTQCHATDVLHEAEPEHRRHRPQLTRRQRRTALKLADEELHVFHLHVPFRVPDQADGQLVNPRVPGQCAARQLGQLLVVPAREAGPDLAQMLLDHVEIVEEPFARRTNVGAPIDGLAQIDARRLENALGLIEPFE